MFNLLLVGAGGFLGAIARYSVMVSFERLGHHSFLWSILAVNVTGAALIGFLAGVNESRESFSNEARLFLFVGLLGGFTTFSAITNDTLTLLRNSAFWEAAANIGLSVSLGLAACAIGYVVGRNT